MPPRIHVSLPIRYRRPTTQWLSGALRPAAEATGAAAATSQGRQTHILATLSDNRGAYHPEKRRGRGPASGLGKTSGRGHKGQKQHGKVPAGFEGGQTPLRIVHGPRGFTNVHTADITVVPLSRIVSWVAQGRIDPSRPITPLQLITSRCVHGISDGIKLLATSKQHANSTDTIGPLTQPLNIVVSEASEAAIAAVEAAGGSVTTRYYTRFALDKIVRGQMHPTVSLRTNVEVARATPGVTVADPEPLAASEAAAAQSSKLPTSAPKPSIRTGHKYRLPDPAHRKDLEYYRDSAKRGYLAYEVAEGEGPSLYFKTLVQKQREQREAGARRRARVSTGETKLVQKRTVRPGERVSLW